MEPKYHHKFVGGNFRLDALQAAVLNVKYPHLESWHQARRNNANLYTKLFVEAGIAQGEGFLQYDEENKVLLPKAVYKSSGHTNYHIYNQYCIRVQNRDAVRAFLGENQIGSEIYYPVPFHRQECFANLGCIDSDYPVSNQISEETIALPIYPELAAEQIAFVVEKIAEFLKR
jgi:dTDP-4-amino-4,6-dideoxygalactose transaminase